MQSVYAGEIGTFPFGYAPTGWACCNGQTLLIEQYKALYAVIGTIYGGDGLRTFALPNLNGRVAVNAGQAPDTSNYALGDAAGANTVAMEETNLPEHDHVLAGGEVTPANPDQNVNSPVVNAMFSISNPKFLYASDTQYPAAFSAEMIDDTGGYRIPHLNDQPSLALNICIALFDFA